MMKRNIQIIISLVLLLLGLVVSTFNAARLSAWSECDARYQAFIKDLDKEGELMLYFHNKDQEDYYRTHIQNFHPSGKWYSGSNQAGPFIVCGGAAVLFGLAGLADIFLRKKRTTEK